MKLSNRDVLIAKIEDEYISIVHANNNKIVDARRLAITDNSIESEINIDIISDKINEYIAQNKASYSGIIFVIQGSDIVIRHAEVPIMEEAKILDAAKWEMTQYLPEQGENYYIDYEIINKKNDEDKKIYNVLVCAAPKEKVNQCEEIAKKTNLKLLSVELNSNNIAKIFETVYSKNKQLEDIGIINFGEKETNFIILKNGKLYFQREIPFGKDNMLKQLCNAYGLSEEIAIQSINKFQINNVDSDEKNIRIKKSIDNIFSSFEKLIQFYFTGKTKKKLDKIFLIGQIANYNGIKEYLNNLFDSEIDTNCDRIFDGLGISSNKIDANKYIFAIGTLLKRNKVKSLNLLSYSVNKKSKQKIKKNVIYRIVAFAGVLVIIAGSLLIYYIKLKGDYKDAKALVANYQSVKDENQKITNKLSLYNKDIEEYNKLKNKDAYTAKWIKDLESQVPQDVKITSIAKVNNLYTITGSSSQGNSSAVFTANLQQTAKYKNAKLVSVQLDTSSYKFTIQIGDNN